LILAPGDPSYPPSLLLAAGSGNIPDPPPVLFVRGVIPRAPGVTIVGTRRASEQASAFTRALIADLAPRGFSVWSGGAIGIDAAAHEAALLAGAPTVVVMGGGLDRPYPPEHRGLFDRILAAGGALVARVADDVAPRAIGFHQRNEILAAATEATVVVQAGYKSGARSTARAARKIGRPLFAVPHAPWDEGGQGCALELTLGARALTCAGDLLFSGIAGSPAPARCADRGRTIGSKRARDRTGQIDLLPRTGERAGERARIDTARGLSSGPEPPSIDHLSTEARALLQVLDGAKEEPLHIDELCDASGLPLRAVVELLLTLTLQTVVVEGPAGFYKRARRWVGEPPP
jgi:DNA processing protein